ERLRERFEPLFAGEWATGIKPDEVNWLAGRDPDDRTRQICNGWKADPAIAAQVLSERSGRLAAELAGWDGVRIGQDNCLWKPPGAAFHHHLTFHGSGPNTAQVHRRAVVSHFIRAETTFHPTHTDPNYSRYRRVGALSLDESFFPIVWTRDGRRSAWLDEAYV